MSRIDKPTQVPGSPLTLHADLGTPATPGSTRCEGASLRHTLTSADEAGHFAGRVLSGDFIVTARVAASSANGPLRLGWTAREGLQPGAAQFSASLDAIGLVEVDVIQLERRAHTWTVSVARHGEALQQRSCEDLELADSLHVGLFVAAGSATFDNVRVVRPLPRLPGLYLQRPICSRLELLDVDTGVRSVIHEDTQLFEAPNWSRDGRFLVINQAGRLQRVDLVDRLLTLIDTGDIVRNNNDHVLSFDGRQIAISSQDPGDGESRIHVLPIDGGRPRRVTRQGPSYLHGWSPDGQYLVYTAQRPGNDAYDIYRIDLDGRHEIRLGTSPRLDDGPEYAPDGSAIWFCSARDGHMQIWRMGPEGEDPQRLTDDGHDDWFPHVSPDGSRVIFLSYLPGEVDPQEHPGGRHVVLRTMPVSGGAPRVVAYLHGGQGSLNVHSWSPDGRRVAFVSHTLPLD
ncbi:TolB family protein [Sphaerotilus mobilis]|uniref:WD40 repeat protein n=1 Tax=Sphaerotilus mobilis TaxID=47994 RepID=A0A4Q7LVM8_9BURK|nr:TolB family protein [Sphaerotilus mobilis]RZS58573.1 WD40 repeat protein [Sphaerotilus mobilis]